MLSFCSYRSLCYGPRGVLCGLLAAQLRRESADEARSLILWEHNSLERFPLMSSSSSSILWVRDLVLVRDVLGRGGLCGFFLGLASKPERHPRWCFLSLLRLLHLLDLTTVQGDPGCLAISSGRLYERWQSFVTGDLRRKPRSSNSFRLSAVAEV